MALKILRPDRLGPTVVVFGLPLALGPAQTVFEDRSGKPSGVPAKMKSLKPVGQSAWLYWEDLLFSAGFEHPSRLILLDVHTGRVLADRRLRTVPLIDGRRPPFLTAAGYYGNRYAIFRGLRHPAPLPKQHAAVQGVQAAIQEVKVPLPAVTSAFATECLLIIGDQGPDERFFPSAIRPMQNALASYGLTRQYYVQSGGYIQAGRGLLPALPVPAKPNKQATPPDGQDLRKAANTLATGSDSLPKCPDIMILIAGHGTANAKGGKTEVGQTSSKGVLTDFYVYGQDIAGILTDNPGTKFKLKIDSCFSGQFSDVLGPRGKYPNLSVLETSANSIEPSWFKGNIYAWDGKEFDEGLSREQAIGVPDPFTSSNLAGWEAFVTSDREVANADSAFGSLLARMIEAGYTLGKDADKARMHDVTHPTLLSNMADSSPLRISKINAVFVEAERATHYTVPTVEDRPGTKITYRWTLKLQCIEPGCPNPNGTVQTPLPDIDTGCTNRAVLQTSTPEFVWHHGDGSPDGCDHTKEGAYGHQGLISVVVSDDQGWQCSATYAGTVSSVVTDIRQFPAASVPICGKS